MGKVIQFLSRMPKERRQDVRHRLYGRYRYWQHQREIERKRERQSVFYQNIHWSGNEEITMNDDPEKLPRKSHKSMQCDIAMSRAGKKRAPIGAMSARVMRPPQSKSQIIPEDPKGQEELPEDPEDHSS